MRIRVLGGLEVASGSGEPVKLATRRTALLLAALVLVGDKGMRRDALCEALWPGRGNSQARASLRQGLVALRRTFPDDAAGSIRLARDSETVALSAPAEDVDAWLFERLLCNDRPSDLAAAADLYQGDLLARVVLPEQLDEWFVPHQRVWRRKALQLTERLSLCADAAVSALAACEGLSERLLAQDAAAEEAHRALIRIYRQQGRENAALRQFELCREALRSELGVEPEARTRALIANHAAVPAASISESTGVIADQQPTLPVRAARDSDPPSLVVMPFDNLSGAEDECFVDGVVEEITATLSRIRDFFVIARQSAFAYKGRFIDVREVGKELGVKYVIEGTIRRAGERVRISVQLANAETRAQLWSDRYEGATTDIFEFQDRIAAHVAGALHPALLHAEIEAAKRKPPGNLRAYELVLQAYPKLWSAIAEENRQAIALLKNASAVDPAYGRAHALLAWCHSQEVVYLWCSDPEQERKNARMAVAAATSSINDDPMAMTAVGAAFSQCLGDLDGATTYIEAALRLDPNNAWAWARYGWLAIYRDEPEQAIERFERALILSPLDPLAFNFRLGIAVAVGCAGDYWRAARLVQEVLSQHPKVAWANRALAAFAALAGDLQTARAAVASLLAAHPHVSVATMLTSHPGRHARHFAMMLEGWRLAGLPEY